MFAERMTTLRAAFASPRSLSLTLLTIAALAGLIVWVAPDERTLGAGIKWVYVHVALTWTGMTGIVVAGALGALTALGCERWFGWGRTIGGVGLAFLIAGAVVSGAAALVNWGGLALDEPRLNATLQIIASGLGVALLAQSGLDVRWKGLLFAMLPVFMFASLTLTPLVLHPRSPIWTSTSLGIQAAFVSLYVLSLAAAASLALSVRARSAGGAR
jgi:hypothetical protein